MKMTLIRICRHIAPGIALGLSGALAVGAAQAQSTGPEAPPRASYRPVYPLKLSYNHRYLVDQNNKPFLIVGDSPQGLMGRLSPQEVEEYFADRQAHGFNTAGWIDVGCAGRDFPDNTAAATYDGILPFTGYVSGGTDYTHYDLSKPNEAYFKRLDFAIESAAKHGIFVFIDPAETIGWLATLRNNGLDASYAYGQYLGRRYGKHANVGWISGNDFILWRIPADDALALAVAKGIQSIAPHQLQTVEINYNTSSSLDDRAWAPIISLNGTYTYAATYIQMLHSYHQMPVMPAYLVEAHYDQEEVGTPTDYGTPEVLRRQEYWAMLSGGTGQFYGNRYTWSLTPGWDSYLDTLGVTQMEIWKGFFSSLPWQDLVPDEQHTTLTAGYGTFGSDEIHLDKERLDASYALKVSESDYATAARTTDGAFVVVYLPTSRTVTINMSRMRSAASAEWLDPTNGDRETISGGPFPNSGSKEFTPPKQNHARDSDWVLLLNATAANAH
jgi:hypothetical protein